MKAEVRQAKGGTLVRDNYHAGRAVGDPWPLGRVPVPADKLVLPKGPTSIDGIIGAIALIWDGCWLTPGTTVALC